MEFKLKIGRNTYDISSDDRFMDNGSCVQLLTQSKERSGFGFKAHPVLSKRAVAEISKYKRVREVFDGVVVVFSLTDKGDS